MIDIHSHILPGLDDGPANWDETISMCKRALSDGIHTIVATPHRRLDRFPFSKEAVLTKVKTLNEILSSNPETQGLKILPGSEIYLEADILKIIYRGDIIFVGNRQPNSTTGVVRYFLLELLDPFVPSPLLKIVSKLVDKSIIPIIAHPERNSMIRRNGSILKELVDAGGLSQVTASSITGGFGRKIRKYVEGLFACNLVHVIATDAHSKTGRPPLLSKAVSEAGKKTGLEKARMMVTTVPGAIINGRKLETG